MHKASVALTLALAAAGCALVACGGGGGGSDVTTEAPRVEASEIESVLADANVVFLDVREPDELEELGTIEGYINIPVDELAERLDEIPKDKPILTA